MNTETNLEPRPDLSIVGEKASRNAPCPCGSGKKYKRCCLLDKAPPKPDRGSGLGRGQRVTIPLPYLIGMLPGGVLALGQHVPHEQAMIKLRNMEGQELCSCKLTYNRVPVGIDPGIWFSQAMLAGAKKLHENWLNRSKQAIVVPNAGGLVGSDGRPIG